MEKCPKCGKPYESMGNNCKAKSLEQMAIEQTNCFPSSIPRLSSLVKKELFNLIRESWQDCLDDGGTSSPIDDEVIQYITDCILRRI